MIAVEWEDSLPAGAYMRTGVLLQVMSCREGNRDVCYAIVVTRRIDGDPWVRGPVVKGQYPQVLLKVDMEQIRVKGVHIPFEPHGAEK